MVYIRRHYQFCSHYLLFLFLFFFSFSLSTSSRKLSLPLSLSLSLFFWRETSRFASRSSPEHTDGAALNSRLSRVICHLAKIGIQFTSDSRAPKDNPRPIINPPSPLIAGGNLENNSVVAVTKRHYVNARGTSALKNAKRINPSTLGVNHRSRIASRINSDGNSTKPSPSPPRLVPAPNELRQEEPLRRARFAPS